jgi:hypothetical protein
VSATQGGLTVEIGGRRYELMGIERPSASALKATIKARRDEKFYVDTVALYSSARRKTFVLEAARFFCEGVDVIEGDVNRLMVMCEQYAAKGAEETAPKAPAIDEGLQREASRMGRNPDLFCELERDFSKLLLVGERSNALMCYLAMTSRKMEEPLAIQILSGSGAGKSHLQDTILSLCPPEDLIKLTSLTDRALFYKGEDSLRHKVLAVSEEAGASGARYALRSLISDKKLAIESTVKNQLTGKLETQFNVVYGPTAAFETTTNPDTDAETKSRYTILSVDESPEQTRAILEAQRHRHTLEGIERRRQREAILAKHHVFQRLLRPLVVVNPYEPLLSYGDDRLAVRRDQPKYLNLILAAAFLHQMQRPIKHHPTIGDYIEVSLDDIARANELAHELFGQSLDDLSHPGRELLRLICTFVRGKAGDQSWEKIDFCRRDLREAIQWSDARLRAHLSELMRLEYLAPLCGGMGSAFRYRLLLDPELIGSGRRVVPGLKSIEQLQKEANLAGIYPHPAGQKGYPAATPQVEICEVEQGLSRCNGRDIEKATSNLAANSKVHIDEIKPAREFSARQSTANGAHP